MHHNQSLIVILIVALFSLASLQGLNLILNRQNSILGETSTIYRCCADRNCSLNCSYRTSTCSGGTYNCTNTVAPRPTYSVGITAPVPQPTTPIISTKTVPCEEITRLQRQYCPAITTYPTPTVLPITPTTIPSTTAPFVLSLTKIEPTSGSIGQTITVIGSNFSKCTSPERTPLPAVIFTYVDSAGIENLTRVNKGSTITWEDNRIVFVIPTFFKPRLHSVTVVCNRISSNAIPYLIN